MKSWFLIILFACLTIFSFIFPFRIAFLENQTHEVIVGPNQTYLWRSDKTLSRSIEDTFYLKSFDYFELKQEKIVKQAVYEEPALGEDSGLYWIRDFPMSGAWNTSSPATIFSMEETTLTVSTSFWYELINYVFAIIGSFVLLVFSFLFIIWLDQIIPD